MKVTTHLDHIRHCNKASGTDWSNRWTYRVVIINTRRDYISNTGQGVAQDPRENESTPRTQNRKPDALDTKHKTMYWSA